MLRTGRRLEREVGHGDLAAGLPVAKLDGVLRRVGDARGRDDVAARTRCRALRHPDLPIHVFGAEGEVVALDAADHPATKVLDVRHLGRHLVVGMGEEQIGSGEGPVELLVQFVHQVVQRARDPRPAYRRSCSGRTR